MNNTIGMRESKIQAFCLPGDVDSYLSQAKTSPGALCKIVGLLRRENETLKKQIKKLKEKR